MVKVNALQTHTVPWWHHASYICTPSDIHPHRFHRVSYGTRMIAAFLLMVLSFSTVAFGAKTWIQLIGVAFCSLQGGLGEASCLALASLYNTPRAVTAWSSGTGFAGIFGYAWVFFFRFVLRISLRSTLLLAHFLAAAWLLTYFVLLVDSNDPCVDCSPSINNSGEVSVEDYSPLKLSSSPTSTSRGGQARGGGIYGMIDGVEGRGGWNEGQPFEDVMMVALDQSGRPSVHVQKEKPQASTMTTRERLCFTLSLWRFMVPLTLVYFAEVRKVFVR